MDFFMTTIRRISLTAALLISTVAPAAHAALYDRGNGMIYDSTQNITWLQDALYAETSGYTSIGMSWADSTAWAANLEYGGFSDWRLTSAKLIGDSRFSYDGSTDAGFNNTRSELGHLFAELGNKWGCNTVGVCNASAAGFFNTTFIDAGSGKSVSFLTPRFFRYSIYWQAEQAAPDSPYSWAFHNLNGEIDNGEGAIAAWAVRDGDVTAVPVPASALLLASGLIGLGGMARRKSK